MLVCWSGGCDSTLCLTLAAKELKTGTPVRALSITHPQVCAAKESEAARGRILAAVRAKGIAVEHGTVSFRQKGVSGGHSGGEGLQQPLLWLAVAVAYLETDETLCMGYIQGDDFWHRRQQFEDAFGALQKVGGRTGQLWFPLEWHSKAEVIASLRREKLYKDCWYCEAPGGGRPCRKCKPCVTHQTALWQLKTGLVKPPG